MTACIRWQYRMHTDFWGHGYLHLLGNNAAHPIVPPQPRLGVLLRLAGSSLLRSEAKAPSWQREFLTEIVHWGMVQGRMDFGDRFDLTEEPIAWLLATKKG
ncbi:MAG: hypothetical protein WEK74_04250, partial [Hydrogenophaga sp.]